jgi:threonine dehydratase
MSPIVINEAIKAVLTARVYDVAIKSPLQKAEKLSVELAREVYLKREDLQPVHSFKLRGAYNKIVQLSKHEQSLGVITASAGNHAQGVALAAQKLGISALIIMPRTTPAIKVEAVKSFGATVELEGDSYSDAAEYCKKRIKETGRTYIHPFDDPLVIAGQGTIGREIVEQLPSCTHIFVPVGGGGLIAGIATYIKSVRPDIKLIGVEPEDSNAMQASIMQKKRVTLSHVGIFADGVAVKKVGENTYPIARDKVDDFITVSTDQICVGIKRVFEDTRSIVEPAGALAIAGIQSYDLPKDSVAVAICSGANMTFERLQQVAERTLTGSGKEVIVSVELPEKPGALRAFCSQIIGTRSITEFSYRKNDSEAARILVGVSVAGAEDRRQLTNRLTEKRYKHDDLSDDDLVKAHIRHMIGGQLVAKLHEHIYEVTFPERPRALADFLETMGDTWNISLFHYRSAASDTGSVLIGFEAKNREMLEKKLGSTGREWTRVDTNTGIETFLRQEYKNNNVFAHTS